MSKSLAHDYQHQGLTAPRDSDIQMPGGNTVSRDRQPTVNLSNLNGLKGMGGSEWPAFNQVLFTTTVDTFSNHNVDPSFRAAAVGAALASFNPVDELEGMIAAQTVALHFTAMECFRRAATPGQTPEAASKLRKDGANLARAMTDMIDAL